MNEKTLQDGDRIFQSELARIVRRSRQAVNEMVKRNRLTMDGGWIIYDDRCREYINKSLKRKS